MTGTGSGVQASADRLANAAADTAEVAAALVERVGPNIVLGLPVGIGKATNVANALFRHVAANPSLQLTIFTALTLEVPRPGSDLERRLLEPLAERLFAGWPEPDYAKAVADGSLPANIEVREFYFRPAAYLGNALAQQHYTSINYSQVADELRRLGVNVIAQLVTTRDASPGQLSLGSNPEVTLELLPYFEARRDHGVALVGEVNRQMPYMTGAAELPQDRFDLLLDNDDTQFPLFGLPNRVVGPADYATGMHVASLVRDGGTLQLGIGSLSDAVAHCLRLRHEQPDVFADVLQRLPGGSATRRRAGLPLECAPFRAGLYACSELMSDALFILFRAGILRRPAGAGDDAVLHAGFFVGSNALYAGLRDLTEDERRTISMTDIGFVNTLYGDEQVKREQRRDARFVNETMMATLLGAAVSDGLEDGRVVSGVGGQFDFVSMAHALHDAMSILVLRARREQHGRPRSNIRWSYGHVTVPRHHRDIFITEYGIAATRGQPDHAVIEAMLGITDAAFQPPLVKTAKKHQKIAADFMLRADGPPNTPQAINEVFTAPDIAGYFPRYPLGTDLTPVEQELADALGWLKTRMSTRWQSAQHVARVLLGRRPRGHVRCLERLDLDSPDGFAERLLRRLVADALENYRS